MFHMYVNVMLNTLLLRKDTGVFESFGRFIIVYLIKVSQLRYMFVLYIYINVTHVSYVRICNVKYIIIEEGHRSVRKLWSFYYRLID